MEDLEILNPAFRQLQAALDLLEGTELDNPAAGQFRNRLVGQLKAEVIKLAEIIHQIENPSQP